MSKNVAPLSGHWHKLRFDCSLEESVHDQLGLKVKPTIYRSCISN